MVVIQIATLILFVAFYVSYIVKLLMLRRQNIHMKYKARTMRYLGTRKERICKS